MRPWTLFVCVFILSAVAPACGKKAPPRPPDEIAPAPIEFFTITPEEKAVVLAWQAPTTDANGGPLTDLASFLIRRSVVEQNAAPQFETIAEVPVTAGDPTTGQYQYRDAQLSPGKRYAYTVIPTNFEGISGVASNALRLTFVGSTSLVESF